MMYNGSYDDTNEAPDPSTGSELLPGEREDDSSMVPDGPAERSESRPRVADTYDGED